MNGNLILNRWMFAAIGSVILTLLSLIFFLWPHFNQSLIMMAEQAKISDKITNASQWEERQKEIEMERGGIASYLSSIVGSLEKNEGMSPVIENIFEIANKNRVTIQQLLPGDVRGNIAYMEMPVQLKISGDYHQFAAMINDYESSGYIIQPVEFTIKSVKDVDDKLQAVLNLRVIRLKVGYKITDENA